MPESPRDLLGGLARHLNDEGAATLLAAMQRHKIPDGTELVTPGRDRDALHLVVFGEIHVEAASGQQAVALGLIGPGGWVGETDLLDDSPSALRATARGQVEVLTLTRDGLGRLREAHPRVAALALRAMVEDLAHRLRECDTALGDAEEAPPQGWLSGLLSSLFGAAR